MQNDKLLPCPFCGGEAEEKNRKARGKSYFKFWCECKECHTKGKAFNTIDHTEPRTRARVFWNTRKPMERIVEQLEEEATSIYADKSKGKKFVFCRRCN